MEVEFKTPYDYIIYEANTFNENDLDTIEGLMSVNAEMNELDPTEKPDIDIQRHGLTMSNLTTVKSLVDTLQTYMKHNTTEDEKKLYRSAKNFVMIYVFSKLSELEREALRKWCKANETTTKTTRTSVPKPLKVKTASNFIEYIDSDRFKINRRFLSAVFKNINDINHRGTVIRLKKAKINLCKEVLQSDQAMLKNIRTKIMSGTSLGDTEAKFITDEYSGFEIKDLTKKDVVDAVILAIDKRITRNIEELSKLPITPSSPRSAAPVQVPSAQMVFQPIN